MNVVSLVGRPNTGKSALFNRIAKKRVAIVFDQPGVTRDRVTREVDVCGRKVMLVDTGGIAFDRRVTRDPLDDETKNQAALAVEDSAVCVIVVDAREGITPLDAEVIKRVRESGVFFTLAAVAVLYFLVAALVLPETKGRSLEEIERFFAKSGAK